VQPAIVFGPFGGAWTKWPAENLIYDTVVLPEDDGLCNALYVDDLVDGLILAAMERAAVGERFILSGPAPVTWGAFFGSIAAALGVRPPERWPAARISTSNQGLVRDLKLVAGNPKKIIQIMVRWPPARQALQAGLNAMPEPLKGLVMKHYFGSGARKPGGIVLPDPQQLRLYQSKAVCDNAKARRLIGYAPRYDLAAGSGPTRLYLEWAYGDVKRAVRAKETSREAAAASGQWTETNAG
jgi:nucleoside-diphosphate-sugar epimerase